MSMEPELDDGDAPDRDAPDRYAHDRDASGRFKGRAGRPGRPSLSRCVGSGRGARSRKTHLQLARSLAEAERLRRRLLGELGLPVDPLPEVGQVRLEGLRRLQTQSVDRRRLAMDTVLRGFAERRVVPTAAALAEAMRLALGLERFAVSQLYRPPLDTMWRELAAAAAGPQSNRSSTEMVLSAPSDWLGRCAGDVDPAVARYLRLPMKELHRRSNGRRDEISDLSAMLAERLMSDDFIWLPLG